jgi:ribosomal protein S11
MKKSKKIEKQAKIADVQRIKAKSKKKKKILIRFNMNNYVIINFYKSNLFINLQEVHGTSRYWTSSGLMGYKGRKKKSYDGSLGHAIKFLRKLTFLGDFKPFIV